MKYKSFFKKNIKYIIKKSLIYFYLKIYKINIKLFYKKNLNLKNSLNLNR